MIMKKILLTISILAFLSATLAIGMPSDGSPAIPTASAQGGKLWNDTSGQQAICRGTRDWGTFISALISYDDFTEYWKDIFVRYNANICQYTDIDSLLTRINTARKQIREAFYVCADTSKMKDTYYRLEAELFYLRKYINTDNGTFYQVNDAQVQKELKDYFVLNKGYFNDAQITQLFNEFKTKYTTRLETYKNCKDATWQNLLDKWNEFRKNAGGFGPAIKQASTSFNKRWERMANTPMKGGQKFLGGFLDARINGMPAKEGLDLIVQELQKNLPQGYTFDKLQATQNYKDKVSAENVDLASYIAQYQAEYGETADDYTFQIMSTLNQLDDIIKTTAPFQNQTVQCTSRLNNKQC
jgi:hypothetical protein